MQNLITINGNQYPQPKRGLGFRIETYVDTATNANGEIVGQSIGRNRQSPTELTWDYLDGKTWRAILLEFARSPVAELTYPDMASGTMKTRKVLIGERSAQPCHLDRETGLPLDYVQCTINVTDMGTPL